MIILIQKFMLELHLPNVLFGTNQQHQHQKSTILNAHLSLRVNSKIAGKVAERKIEYSSCFVLFSPKIFLYELNRRFVL